MTQSTSPNSSPIPRKSRSRTVTHYLPVALAMCPPAVRMLVVHVWACRTADGSWHEDKVGEEHARMVYPVLALTAHQGHRYHRFANPGESPSVAPTHRGMEERGWHFSGSYVDSPCFTALIYDPDYGLVEANDCLGDCANGVYEVVPAPWPESEDAERLKPVFDRLRDRAREKVEREERAQEGSVTNG